MKLLHENINSLIYNKIGGGKSQAFPSLRLYVQRFSCALLLACMLTGCLEPIPIDGEGTSRGTEVQDSTVNVDTEFDWEGWNEPDTIAFGFGG